MSGRVEEFSESEGDGSPRTVGEKGRDARFAEATRQAQYQAQARAFRPPPGLHHHHSRSAA